MSMSKISNLALMKLSAYHKSLGDNVVLKRGTNVDLSDKPDKAYISVIFKKNKQAVDDLVSKYPDITFDIGGSQATTFTRHYRIILKI